MKKLKAWYMVPSSPVMPVGYSTAKRLLVKKCINVNYRANRIQ